MAQRVIPDLSMLVVPSLPAAADHAWQFRVQGGKAWLSDGTDWIEIGGGGVYRKHEVFTSSGTFTLPSTAHSLVDYDLAGGGAGAGAASGDTNQVGGGGGSRKAGTIELTPGDSYSVLVGAGGAGTTNITGSPGGDTSFAGITAPGAPTGGVSGDGIAPSVFAGGASPTSGAAASISPNATTGPNSGQTGRDGICSGGASWHPNAPNTARIASTAGQGAGAVGNGANGGDATGVGCGGGACRNGAGTFRGGNGFRGEVRITYWDTVP